MQITVPCHACTEAKRPLSPCPWCSSDAAPQSETAAWRSALHAFHLARITAEPRLTPAPPAKLARPIQVVVTMGGAVVTSTDPILIPDSVVPAADPLSFDWDESRGLRRLRRSA